MIKTAFHNIQKLSGSTDWKKIHVTIDVSSVTGGLRQNFGTASSITQCAEMLANDEEKFWHMMTGTEI